MTALEFLKLLKRDFYCAPNVDDKGRRPVSNSQLERWLNQGAVHINGGAVKACQELSFPVTSLVYFPKNPERRITLR